VRAHEESLARPYRPPGCEVGECIAFEVNVPASSVTRGSVAGDQTDVFEYVEVVGEQVRGEIQHCLQFDRRPVRDRQFVGDGKANRITEGGVAAGALGCRRVGHNWIMTLVKD